MHLGLHPRALERRHSGKRSKSSKMELVRPASGSYGSLEYSVGGGRYSTTSSSSATRHVNITSNLATGGLGPCTSTVRTSKMSYVFHSCCPYGMQGRMWHKVHDQFLSYACARLSLAKKFRRDSEEVEGKEIHSSDN